MIFDEKTLREMCVKSSFFDACIDIESAKGSLDDENFGSFIMKCANIYFLHATGTKSEFEIDDILSILDLTNTNDFPNREAFEKCTKDGKKYVDGYGGEEAFLVMVRVKDRLATSPGITGDWENEWVLDPFDWCEENCIDIWSFGKPFTPELGYFDWRFFFKNFQDAIAFSKHWNGRVDIMERYGLIEI